VSAGRSRFLVDLGWPGMFGALEANLRRMDIPLGEISHGFATHYHMDPAGAAQELKRAGMRLVVFDVPASDPGIGPPESIRCSARVGDTLTSDWSLP
jgi:glyoxylase-like metal-dependent hydrolase (beta-lactamase superfamily II)